MPSYEVDHDDIESRGGPTSRFIYNEPPPPDEALALDANNVDIDDEAHRLLDATHRRAGEQQEVQAD
jgi:hypothetical protein